MGTALSVPKPPTTVQQQVPATSPQVNEPKPPIVVDTQTKPFTEEEILAMIRKEKISESDMEKIIQKYISCNDTSCSFNGKSLDIGKFRLSTVNGDKDGNELCIFDDNSSDPNQRLACFTSKSSKWNDRFVAYKDGNGGNDYFYYNKQGNAGVWPSGGFNTGKFILAPLDTDDNQFCVFNSPNRTADNRIACFNNKNNKSNDLFFSFKNSDGKPPYFYYSRGNTFGTSQ